jgi:hypothetical protein
MMNLELLPELRLSALAVDLPGAITPAMAGVVVGALCGVLAFVVALAIIGRRSQKVARVDAVVRIPPYAASPPGHPSSFPPPRFVPLGPTTGTLAFARAGFDGGPEIEILAELEVDSEQVLDDSDLIEVEPLPQTVQAVQAVTVTPVVMLNAPDPLGIIPASSSAMRGARGARGASMAEFEVDDSPTEIGETFFDEPPRPRARAARPKIRAISPAPPRHP